MENTERPERRPLTRRQKMIIGGTALFILCLVTTLTLLKTNPLSLGASVQNADNVALGSFPVTIPTVKYGFTLDTFAVTQDTFRSGEYLGDILLRHKIGYSTIQQLATNADTVFKINRFRVNRPYMILAQDTAQGADYFVYEPSVYEYVVFHLKGDLLVERIRRPVTTVSVAKGGVIESSLWSAVKKIGETPELFVKLEDALQWSVDFNFMQGGETFKAVYDQNTIEGQNVGVGFVRAAYWDTGDTAVYAIYYEGDKEHEGYYDLEGRPMNKGFLKSPVKASRISSYYNLNRFHPILKRRRPHFGTDYAAPRGTPIQAVGAGVVSIASYTKGNGNYVKIKHDDTYQTQYLHMNGFAKGIKAGTYVKQGQTIGYVGSTGLATGPHVCFRFWKNGRQVNHLNLNFPPPEPLPESELEDFFAQRDRYLAELEKVVLPAPRISDASQ
ncbi:MAG: peptidoglycan DD-metalloendopeptidase family protein [Saprospiraceae bacterium]|nr:peptidoglycan DD-metalloendopeptidase family protein [Saprospiraceae bacterium]